MVCGVRRALCSASLSRERDKTLADFAEVLDWARARGFEPTVIGGIAVGALAARIGVSSLSGDLDLLVSPRDQRRFADAATMDPMVGVVKRPKARGLPVLVLDWAGLEVDVLVESDGMRSPADVRERALDLDGVSVADPVDLLTVKLAMRREKDLEHIKILRVVCEGFSLFGLRKGTDRAAFRFLRRWADSEGWESIPEALFLRLLNAAGGQTSAAARRYLAQHAPTQGLADAVVSAAPHSESSTLRTILKNRFG